LFRLGLDEKRKTESEQSNSFLKAVDEPLSEIIRATGINSGGDLLAALCPGLLSHGFGGGIFMPILKMEENEHEKDNSASTCSTYAHSPDDRLRHEARRRGTLGGGFSLSFRNPL
jgi:hypothetical protein